MFGHDDDQPQNNFPGQTPDDNLTATPSQVPGASMAGSASESTAGMAADTYAPATTSSFTPSSVPSTPALPSAEPADDTATAPLTTSAAESDDLLDIKQQALQQLTPLMGHLDQTPEEEFRTTMMMIQASDNQELIKKAYAAAQRITDEKARAQALLDVVNEINYFTHNRDDAAAA